MVTVEARHVNARHAAAVVILLRRPLIVAMAPRNGTGDGGATSLSRRLDGPDSLLHLLPFVPHGTGDAHRENTERRTGRLSARTRDGNRLAPERSSLLNRHAWEEAVLPAENLTNTRRSEGRGAPRQNRGQVRVRASTW